MGKTRLRTNPYCRIAILGAMVLLASAGWSATKRVPMRMDDQERVIRASAEIDLTLGERSHVEPNR